MPAGPAAVIVGIDGVPLEALEAAMERGLMPFLRSRWQRMAKSRLDVLIPLTAPSWASISTGVNPGKHGVYDFFKVTPGGLKPVAKGDLERPLVTEIAAAQGLQTVALGVPLAYPPFVRRNTIVVSGWLTPRLEAWPPEERETAKRYGVDVEVPKPSDLEGYVDAVLEGLERKLALAQHYLERRDWRLYYIMVPETDWLFHYTYGEIVEWKPLGRRAARVFTLIDRLLRMVYENAPEDTLVTLCSDHGFTIATKALNGNVLLERSGLLRRATRRLSLRARLTLAAAAALPPWLKHRLKYKLAPLARRLGAAEAFEMSSLPVDYEKSLAFMTTSYTVYTNPTLPKGEKRRIAERVISLFKHHGGDMLHLVERGDRVFWGPHLDRAPDVVVIPRDGYNITTKLIYKRIVEEGRWYVHSLHGLLALDLVDGGRHQPRLPAGRLPRSTEIAPTVLAHLGLPLDPEMDGSPLLDPQPKLPRRSYRILAKLGKAVAKAASAAATR